MKKNPFKQPLERRLGHEDILLGHRGTDSERLDVFHGLFVKLCGSVIRPTFICMTLVQSGQFYQLDLDFGG